VNKLIKKHITAKATEVDLVPYSPSTAIRPELVFVKGQLETLKI
jgi:hypothetical protein